MFQSVDAQLLYVVNRNPLTSSPESAAYNEGAEEPKMAAADKHSSQRNPSARASQIHDTCGRTAARRKVVALGVYFS
jgi:hypothetical protein